jgi:hypothetical protein
MIPTNHKYALLSLPDRNSSYEGNDIVDLGNGYYFSRQFPFKAPVHLTQRLGELSVRSLGEANFNLIAITPSASPGVVDGETERLRKSVYRLYLGLLISVGYFGHGEALLLTGGNASDEGGAETTVSSSVRYERTWWTEGSPQPRITASHLREAARFAVALDELHDPNTVTRIDRAVGTYRNGCTLPFIGDRLHQFVRAAEGLLDPPFGKAAGVFAERAQLITHGKFREHYYEMYVIRSATEHLRGPMSRIKGDSTEERDERLLRRAIEAQTLAQFVLWEFLGNRALWHHFKDDATIEAFWKQPHGTIRNIWRTRLDLAGATRNFEINAARHKVRYR